MKNKKYIAMICRLFVVGVLISSLSSCVQNVATPDLPFAEQMVVSSFLYADSNVAAVSVSRSLPLNVQYTYAQATVTNATVTINTPSGDVSLIYDSARYEYRVPLTVKVGSTYTLHVNWNGKNATAVTTIPEKPVVTIFEAIRSIDAGRGGRTRIQYTAYFPPNPKVAYCIANSAYLIQLSDSTASDTLTQFNRGLPNFRNVVNGGATDTSIVLEGNAAQAGGQGGFGGPSTLDSAQFAVAKFNAVDPTFFNFWKTFRNTKNVSLLGSFGTNPIYNVKGDGIGVFVGVSPSTGWKICTIQ